MWQKKTWIYTSPRWDEHEANGWEIVDGSLEMEHAGREVSDQVGYGVR